MFKRASVSGALLVVAVLVCLRAGHCEAKEMDGPKVCQSAGFGQPVGKSFVGECYAICMSKDNSSVYHYAREGECTWKEYKEPTCHFGECYSSPKGPFYEEDDYEQVEFLVKGYQRNKDAKPIKEPVIMDLWVAGVPETSVSYGKNRIICSVATNNKPGVASMPFKVACRARTMDVRNYIRAAIALPNHEIVDAWRAFRVVKHLDKGEFILASKEGQLTMELKRYVSKTSTPRPKIFPNRSWTDAKARDRQGVSSADEGSSRRLKTSKRPKAKKRKTTTTGKPVVEEYEY